MFLLVFSNDIVAGEVKETLEVTISDDAVLYLFKVPAYDDEIVILLLYIIMRLIISIYVITSNLLH